MTILPIVLIALDLVGYPPPQFNAYANLGDCLAAKEKAEKTALAQEAAAEKSHNGQPFAAEKKLFFACVTRETAEHILKDPVK